MIKRTVITGPDGKTTTIVEQRRGCLWWLGLFGIVLFMIGLIAVYPLLLIPTVIIGALAIVGYITQGRKKK